jgi:crossover junction endodeoxyribonuclease RuvC
VRVLGVDPGLTRCGLGVVEATGPRAVRLVAAGVVRSSAEDDVDRRLLAVCEQLEQWVEEHAPDVLAVEQVFAQANVRTVIGTAQVAGVAMLLAARRGIPVATHTPSEVKAAVTGSGRADKAQVQTMVRKILGIDEPIRPVDVSDALALAICHLWRPQGALAGPRRPRGVMTPAQQAWAEAERAARRRR